MKKKLLIASISLLGTLMLPTYAAVNAPHSPSSVVTLPALPPTEMDRLMKIYLQSMPIDWDNPGRSFVAVGPYLNVPIQYSGSDLIINDPKINTDVALLRLRKAVRQEMLNKGITTENETHHSHLILSGILEAQGQYLYHGQQGESNLSSGNNGSSNNINLSAAEIDGFLLTPSPWVSGYFAFSYQDGTDPIETNSRVLNSNVILNNAFIMLGDFTCSPFYSTVGQMFVPFGTYSSVFISSPLTRRMAKTKARAILAGYQGQAANSFYTALYAFKGDSHASSTSRVNNAGVNVGYRFNLGTPNVNGDVGAGWIANIADSVGMQNTGNQPEFNGFAGPVPYGNEKIVHRVPALNLRGKLSLGTKVDLIAEYVGATTSFNPNDLQFNASGAKPWAVNTEAVYTFSVLDKPTSLGVDYEQAHEAMALGFPEKRVGAILNTSVWPNTIQSLEFRHDINYAAGVTATGSNVSPVSTGMGTYDNIVTLQFDVYF